MHAGKWHLAEALLECHYSPEQLSGLYRLLGIEITGLTWIYEYARAAAVVMVLFASFFVAVTRSGTE